MGRFVKTLAPIRRFDEPSVFMIRIPAVAVPESKRRYPSALGFQFVRFCVQCEHSGKPGPPAIRDLTPGRPFLATCAAVVPSEA
jgi:hypothetical protein